MQRSKCATIKKLKLFFLKIKFSFCNSQLSRTMSSKQCAMQCIQQVFSSAEVGTCSMFSLVHFSQVCIVQLIRKWAAIKCATIRKCANKWSNVPWAVFNSIWVLECAVEKKHSNSKFRNLSFSVAEQFVAKGQMWCVQFSAASECASRPTRYQHDFADQAGAQEKFKSWEKTFFSAKILLRWTST